MNEKIEKFKKMYTEEIIINKDSFSDELRILFDDILVNNFNENHVLMDELIEEMTNENTEQILSENEVLKTRIEMLETTILEIADLALG